jgi:uncharacterized repeat protein (TIGR03843 family)
VSSPQLRLLARGRIELLGRVVGSSNATFLARVSHDGEASHAIYKPQAGERPLFDFESGLHRRERAAYLLSEHLRWGIVPPTVIRQVAPLGVGSLQWFIDGDPTEHYFTLYADAPQTHAALARLAVFDCIANNADRKSGHVLRGHDGRIWGIDHGLCFAASPKLRTVIWDFAGDPIPEALLEDIAPLAEHVPTALAGLLDDAEATALRRRARRLLRERVLPVDTTGMRYPWPLI